jgi:raffinose/stachyose/melibiose transport system permease protein
MYSIVERTRKGKVGDRRTRRFRWRTGWDAYILVAPAVLVFAFFVIYPLIRTVQLSLYDYELTAHTMNFVGLQNYVRMLGDPVFWISIRNNMIILVGSVVIQVGFGLVLAALLNRVIKRGRTFFRTVIFAPVVMSSVAVGVLWQIIYDPNVGLLNTFLQTVGLPTPKQGWLGDPQLAIFMVLLTACWQYTGFAMVIQLAGMQSVPNDLYESAMLDGASERQSFLYITIPMIRNVIFVAMLLTMIGAFKVFDLVYVITRGGPAHNSEVLGTYIYYSAFTVDRAGYASALAVILLIFAITLGFAQLRLSRKVGE